MVGESVWVLVEERELELELELEMGRHQRVESVGRLVWRLRWEERLSSVEHVDIWYQAATKALVET